MKAEVHSWAAAPQAVTATLGVRGVWHVDVHDPLADPDLLADPEVGGRFARWLDLVSEQQPTRDEEDPVLVESFYGFNETFARWRESIPSAGALQALYNPYGTLADGTPIDSVAGPLFATSLDGQGIRSRGAVLAWLLCGTVADVPPPSDESGISWASLACGASVAVLDAVAQLPLQQRERLRLHLLDRDDAALDMSAVAAKELGLSEQVRLHSANVLSPNSVFSVVPRASCAAVECLGFFEYLPHRGFGKRVDAATFLGLARDLVRPGGRLLFANMLDTHPQLPFTLHVVRWPMIQPRSLDEILAIVDDAGIARSQVEVWLPADGVYAVLDVHC